MWYDLDMNEKKDTRPNPYPVRIPEELRGPLEENARKFHRSLAGEILTALEWYVENLRKQQENAR